VDNGARMQVDLDVVPDEDDPHAILTLRDCSGAVTRSALPMVSGVRDAGRALNGISGASSHGPPKGSGVGPPRGCPKGRPRGPKWHQRAPTGSIRHQQDADPAGYAGSGVPESEAEAEAEAATHPPRARRALHARKSPDRRRSVGVARVQGAPNDLRGVPCTCARDVAPTARERLRTCKARRDVLLLVFASTQAR